MSDPDKTLPEPGNGESGKKSAVDERLRDLAELEEEIRRRLRSNERFLERFLDEDFVDDESGEDEDDDSTGEEL